MAAKKEFLFPFFFMTSLVTRLVLCSGRQSWNTFSHRRMLLLLPPQTVCPLLRHSPCWQARSKHCYHQTPRVLWINVFVLPLSAHPVPLLLSFSLIFFAQQSPARLCLGDANSVRNRRTSANILSANILSANIASKQPFKAIPQDAL